MSSNDSHDANQLETNNDTKITKNQLKKKLKLEKRLQYRAEKRKKERETKKLKRLEKKAQINDLKLDENDSKSPVAQTRKLLKNNLMKNSSNKLRLCIDCSFENLMNDCDLSHLCKQIGFCYATNRRLKSPLQFYVSDYKSKTKEILDKMGATNWDVYLNEENFLKIFENEILNENVCYLTSDSPNELDKFDENKIYIIGGLVDHNHHKSLCYNLALKNNLKHYQLPINKYMNMKTRQVLTVNQVFEIICKYIETNDWQAAFMSILPRRKGATCVQTIQSDCAGVETQ